MHWISEFAREQQRNRLREAPINHLESAWLRCQWKALWARVPRLGITVRHKPTVLEGECHC